MQGRMWKSSSLPAAAAAVVVVEVVVGLVVVEMGKRLEQESEGFLCMPPARKGHAAIAEIC